MIYRLFKCMIIKYLFHYNDYWVVNTLFVSFFIHPIMPTIKCNMPTSLNFN